MCAWCIAIGGFFFAAVFLLVRRWIKNAPYGVEIPGVGFVETDEKGKPKHVRDL